MSVSQWTILTCARRLSGLIFLFLISIPAFSDETDIPSVRSFFPLTPTLAEDFNRTFDIPNDALKGGIYYSHPEDGRYRVLIPAGFTKQLSFNAAYLADDLFIRRLYGESRWRRHGTKRAGAENFNEFAFIAGTIATTKPDGTAVKQLWVVSPERERWMLYEWGEDTSLSRYFMETPASFFPVSHGAVAFPKSWSLTVLFASSKSYSKFKFSALDRKEHAGVQFTVAVTSKEEEKIPLTYYHYGQQKVLFAGWDSVTKKAPETNEVELLNEERMNLYLLDLKTLQVDQLLSGLKYPFAFEEGGVFLGHPEPAPGKIAYRAIDWKKGTLAKDRKQIAFEDNFRPNFIDGRFRLVSGVGTDETVSTLSEEGTVAKVVKERTTPKLPTKDELYQLELLGAPEDLLNQVRTASVSTYWNVPHFNTQLSNILGRARSPLAVLPYEKEADPRDLLGAYFWNLDTHSASVPPALRRLTHVFIVTPDLLNKAETRDKWATPLADSLNHIKAAISGKDVIAYFHDYPTVSLALNAEEMKRAKRRMEMFDETFGKCAAAGECRVILAQRRTLWEQLRKADGKLLDGAGIVPLHRLDVSLDQRRRLARALLDHRAYWAKVQASEKAFLASFAAAEAIREEQQDRRVRDLTFYRTFYEELAQYAARNLTGDTKQIDVSLVEKFKAFRQKEFGHWKVEVAAFGDRGAKVPLWVSKTGERNPVLSETLLKSWEKEPARLLASNIYSHGLFFDGGDLKNGGAGTLYLLRAESDPVKVFEGVSLPFLALHPDGFFALVVQEKKSKFVFFKMNRVANPDPKVAPGAQKLLSEELTMEEFLRGDLKLKYQRGRIQATHNGVPRLFGPDGEEDPEDEG